MGVDLSSGSMIPVDPRANLWLRHNELLAYLTMNYNKNNSTIDMSVYLPKTSRSESVLLSRRLAAVSADGRLGPAPCAVPGLAAAAGARGRLVALPRPRLSRPAPRHVPGLAAAVGARGRLVALPRPRLSRPAPRHMTGLAAAVGSGGGLGPPRKMDRNGVSN